MRESMDNEEGERENGAAASWPYASLLVFGFFGADTAAGRRLVWRSTLALALVVTAAVALRSGNGSAVLGVPAFVWALVVPFGVASIAWAQARYVASLDELARMLQLRALAFSYGTVMTLAAALYGVSMAGRLGVPADLFVAVLVLAEPIRGAALAYLARRHE